MGNGGTGGDGDTAGTGSIEPGGRVKFNLFFDIWYMKLITTNTQLATLLRIRSTENLFSRKYFNLLFILHALPLKSFSL